MSSSLAGLQTMCSDEETGALSPENKDAEELGKVQARFYTTFDTLMTNSNSLIATYRTLVQCHGDCERLMKELVALGPSNSVTATVQTLQNHKAQLEQDMLVAEGVQCETWKTIQVLHDASELTG